VVEAPAPEPPAVEPSGEYGIVANGLTKHFGSTVAVDGVDLRVREGEFFGFLGPNGAGKTTTIRMLCGLLRPTAGRVWIAGRELANEPLEVKREIGVLPEEVGLYERLTGREFLEFAGRMHGLDLGETRRRSGDLLELLDLAEARDKLIVDYSMGMKKKTAFAAALIHGPKVMFLDEPFGGIDPISVRAIRDVLRQLTERGTTIFFTTHVMEVAERLCTRVAIINRGRIVGEGGVAELRAKAEAGDRSRRGAGAGGDSTLEDIFLKLVEARVDEETLSWL
jgi:ABC-2 type transport system ATP-binding protein